ncbi:MAG: glutaredoxin family protein [Deltaproteobacteria bacterium]|nr:glutaredoxin family protein [Deltaproteobacteria bacterium]
MAAKEFFRQKGIAFQEFDLSKDQGAVTRMLRLTRQKRVPVIQKGEKYVVGFHAEELEKLIKPITDQYIHVVAGITGTKGRLLKALKAEKEKERNL